MVLRRENNRWLGWKRFLITYALSMEDKMAVGELGALGFMGEMAFQHGCA